LKDEVPQDVAERPYELWVMRAAELVHGDYPEDRWEAARLLLARMRDRFVDNVSPNAFASVLHALAPALLPDKNAEIVLYCWDAA
jgi:hypothetical protein